MKWKRFGSAGVAALFIAVVSSPHAVEEPEPTPSQIPSGLVLRVVSGETGLPVAGARVIVNRREYTTDGQGQITLAETFRLAPPLDIVAPGFLDRQTWLRASSETGFGSYDWFRCYAGPKPQEPAEPVCPSRFGTIHTKRAAYHEPAASAGRQ